MQTSRPNRFAAVLALAALAAAPLAVGQPERAPAGQPPIQPQGQPDGPRRPGPPGGPGGMPGGEFRNVEQAMKVMNRTAKGLAGALDDTSKRDQALTAISVMQRAAVYSKGAKPEHLKPGASVDDYRKSMITLVGYMLELETAVIDGKADAAKAAFKKIEDHRDASHEKFAEEEKEEKEDNGKK